LKSTRLTLPDHGDDLAALVTGLVRDGEPAFEPPQALQVRFCDTFDWRLHAAGQILEHDGAAWRLVDLETGASIACDPVWSDRWPRFAADFPDTGDLQPHLHKLLKMRALVHLATAHGERQGWTVLNRDRKIVLRGSGTRLDVERPEPGKAAAPVRWLDLHPLRGYEDHAEAFLAAAAADHALTVADEPPLVRLLRRAGRRPGGYSSRFEAQLAPTMSAREAFTVVSQTLLRAMRHNEAGVTADLDTEFLHDLRVAVRRQRSALSIFKEVLPPETTEHFSREFAALGRLTGPLRDLDVYLLDEARYRDLVPDSLQPGLDRLFARLRTQRAHELQRVRLALASPQYQQLVQSWQTTLNGPERGNAADQPVLDLARRRLDRRWRRLLRQGRRIGPKNPDSDLHRLRIQGKKLRYLLEFFASLFSAEVVDALVRQLKQLQDNLGAFNDLSVQRQRLQDDLDSLVDGGCSHAALIEATALGGLITALATERRRVRKRFARTFADFAGPATSERFAELLATKAPGPAPDDPPPEDPA
jgi:CHAD domain-containing protein